MRQKEPIEQVLFHLLVKSHPPVHVAPCTPSWPSMHFDCSRSIVWRREEGSCGHSVEDVKFSASEEEEGVWDGVDFAVFNVDEVRGPVGSVAFL